MGRNQWTWNKEKSNKKGIKKLEIRYRRTVLPSTTREIEEKIHNVGEIFVNKWGANGFWCLRYCCLVPSLLGAARRHPEDVHLTLWAVNADASTATLQIQTNKQTDKRSFRISSWRRNCHRLGGDREILPRAIKIQCLCILKNKNKHSNHWHFCDEENYPGHVEAQEMQSRLKLREMQQEESDAHHQNCDGEQCYVPTLVVRCFGWNPPLALDPWWKAHASFALVRRPRVDGKKHQPSSWTEGFPLELLALMMLSSSPSSCWTAQTPYPELVKKAGDSFSFFPDN